MHTQVGSYNTTSLINALRDLRRRLRTPVVLIWDGLPSHRSQLMSEFVRRNSRWLQIERLPAYAPDFNPCEGLWAHLKGGELVNRAESTIGVVAELAQAAARRAGRSQQLLFGFLAQTGLSFCL